MSVHNVGRWGHPENHGSLLGVAILWDVPRAAFEWLREFSLIFGVAQFSAAIPLWPDPTIGV